MFTTNLGKRLLILVAAILSFKTCYGQKQANYDAVYSGVPWFDDHGNAVNAHGANIVKDNGKFYLYGEAHSDTSNAFGGFNCYSSTDLYNWKFESIALPLQKSGRLGPNRIGERPKVLKCPKTGEYILLMHTDTLGYRDPCVGYATSASPTGPYLFRGPLLFNGKPIKKWDMGTFQDADGSGYLLVHGGNIFKLSDDYKSISEQVLKDMSPECESPAVFKKGDLYYWLASNRTSWECNDNFYYTAKALKGPWIPGGNFAPKGTLTWNSQTTFVLPIPGPKDTTFLFMGDRWSYPRQASAATYVWQPLVFLGTTLSLPNYQEAWQINTKTGIVSARSIPKTTIKNTDTKSITYSAEWHKTQLSDSLSVTGSDVKGSGFSVKFNGTQIDLYLASAPKSGYAIVTVSNSKGIIMANSIVDTYSKYPNSTFKFITPILVKDNYTLIVYVLGDHASWSDKRKSNYGSTGNMVYLDKVVIKE